MTHDAELNASKYLGTELTEPEREALEAHLMECEECWREVDAARRGRHLAEQAREFAPLHVRDRARQALTTPVSLRRRMVKLRLAAATIVVAAVAAVAGVLTLSSSDPDVMQAAVAVYAASRLPGSSTPSMPAPDLSDLQLTEVGAGAGELAGIPVSAYAFRDPAGRRVMVYIGGRAFPVADDARPLDGSDGPWIAQHDGTSVLCARYPHELLIVGKDESLVRAAAETLGVT
ncbi:MAG TPA: anti-sigma factor [Actinomycetota bacterium]|jgi:hypothetical protein|nr:anti-sigma factor [Actinomycetota bacterium]